VSNSQSCRLVTELNWATRFAFLAHLNVSQSHVKYPKLWTSYSIKEGHKVCIFSCIWLFHKVILNTQSFGLPTVLKRAIRSPIVVHLAVPNIKSFGLSHRTKVCLSSVSLGLLCCKACTDSMQSTICHAQSLWEEGKENMPVSNSSGAAQHESLHTMQGQDFTMHSWKA